VVHHVEDGDRPGRALFSVLVTAAAASTGDDGEGRNRGDCPSSDNLQCLSPRFAPSCRGRGA
jgi:hypothetical protein